MLRSVFTKTLRDQRWPILAWGLGLGMVAIVVALAWAHAYPDEKSRQLLAAQAQGSLSVASLLYGEPHHIDTLPGFVEWRSLGLTRVMFAIFAVLAASTSTRGGEESGTIECVVASPISRRRVFLEQASAVVLTMACSCGLMFVAVLLIGPITGAGHIGVDSALLSSVDLFLVAMLAAGMGMLFGQFTTARRSAALIAGGLVIAMHVWDNLCYVTTSMADLRWLSPLYLASRSSPLGEGHFDVASAAGLALMGIALVAATWYLTPRRDLFAVLELPWRSQSGEPRAVDGRTVRRQVGLRSVFLHGLSDARGGVAAWGLGLAVFAGLMAGVTPAIRQAWSTSSSGSITQLLGTQVITDQAVMSFAVFGILPLFLTFFALTLASGWTSEELDGRLEIELSSPLSRGVFFFEKASASLASVATVTLLMGVGLFVVIALSQEDVSASRALLALVLLLPLAGAVLAFGYFVSALRPRLVVVTGAFALLISFVLDIVVPLFGWPDFLQDISVFHLYGTPMLDGVVWPQTLALIGATAAFLAGGSVLFERRDIDR